MQSKLVSDLKLTLNGFGLEVDMSSQLAKKELKIFEYGISYVERTYEEGKKITFLDGLLTYYYLFKTRFLQNNLHTSISIAYSFLFMTYAGTYFGMGIGKIICIFFFMIIGLMLGINRRIIPLSVIFIGMYVGSLFSKGNGKIYTVLFLFFVGYYYSKQIVQYFKNKNLKYITKFFL